MNPTAAFPVHTLTPDQAAEELELLCDERFLVEDNPIEFSRWKKEKAQRVTELEVWIMTQSSRAVEKKPAAVAEVLDRFIPPAALAAPEPTLADPLPSKAGPGPYQEPTAKEIRDLLPKRGPSLEVQVQLHPDLAAHLNQVLEDARSMLPAWVRPVVEELARARAKFPRPDHITLALAEESGEVVKAMLDLRNGKAGATLQDVHGEIIQTMAMCVRLLEEGDPAVLPVIPAEKAG